MTPSSPSATTRQADPRIPSEVTEAIRAYKYTLMFTPRLEQQAERALVQAVADATEQAFEEGAGLQARTES